MSGKPAGSGVATFATEHPTGIGGAIAAGIVVLCQSQGWTHFNAEEAAIIVGAITAVLSLFSPRFRTN